MFQKAVLADTGTTRSTTAFPPLHPKWGLFQQFEKHWAGGLHNLPQAEPLMGPGSHRTQPAL